MQQLFFQYSEEVLLSLCFCTKLAICADHLSAHAFPHCPPASLDTTFPLARFPPLIDSLFLLLPPFLPVLSGLYWINESPSRRYQDKHKSGLRLTRK